MCDNCEHRFKCYTTRTHPRRLNGVAWQFARAIKQSCAACLYSTFRQSTYVEDFAKTGICNKHKILIHKYSTCKNFKNYEKHRTYDDTSYKIRYYKRHASGNVKTIKGTYRESDSRRELAIYIKEYNRKTKLPLVCFGADKN